MVPPAVIRKHSSSGRHWCTNSSYIEPDFLSLPSRAASMEDSDSDSSMPRRSQNTTTAAMPPMPKAMRQPHSEISGLAQNVSITNRVSWASTWPPTRVT
ncbi:hypothetical protein D3C81_458890 [compost metagenome]